jgi:hypothetical protein
MCLEIHVENKAREIHTEKYSMSIGEIISMYQDKELDIHPDFQRFFRWLPLQKTKLIESILLGIPIPTIFVSQNAEGVWDVIDGVQRLSTILEFTGFLKKTDGSPVPASTLVKTEYLPALEGKKWDIFPQSLKLDFKRKRLDFQIISRTSDSDTKYDLFQRLNTLGSRLSDQELRNCLLIMLNKDWYEWLKTTSEIESFKKCIGFSDKQTKEKFDMEIALRLLLFYDADIPDVKGMADVNDFLTEKMKKVAIDIGYDQEKEKNVFKKTFDYIDERLGEDSFRKYDTIDERFKGTRFLISAFEAVALGIAYNMKNNTIKSTTADEFVEIIKAMWNDQVFSVNIGSGSNAKTRLPFMMEYGRKLFSDEST